MPFYEYECSNCKFYVEALQKISDQPLKQCPSCKKQTLKKLVSAPVFRLKGGGWYETDFKSDKEDKRNLAGKEEAAETKADEGRADGGKDEKKPAEAKAAADAKADKKPAAKSETASAKKSKTKPATPRKAVSKPKTKTKAAAKKKRR